MITFKITKISNDACINLIIRASVPGLLYGIICYILALWYKKTSLLGFSILKKYTIMLHYHSKFMTIP